MAKNLIEEKNNTENSNDAFEYKVIYVFEINNSSEHKGLIKIGVTTLHTNLSSDSLSPLSSELNKAAKERINSYTETAGLTYNLLWTELAIKTDNQTFSDYQVHKVLKNSGIEPIILGDSKEWFAIDLETAKKAIATVKSNLL